MPSLPPIVSFAEVDELDPGPVIVDVRWYLDGRDGRTAFEAGHVPGAVFVDLDRWLARPASEADGRHPLPTAATFAEGMRQAGASDDTPVVVYDDLGGMVAGRLVWMLRSLGHPAALIDGGLAAWTADLHAGASPTPQPGSFSERDWPADRLVDADALAEHVDRGGVVIDARAPERYRGEVEPVDTRAGHIPGAVNLPVAGNLDESGRFLPADRLRSRFADVGERAIVYCGSGVSACHDLLAMERAGIDDARLYVGSWSQWSADPTRAVATGTEP